MKYINRVKNDNNWRQIDKESFVPAYIQLAKMIEDKINMGELLPGDRIPSKTELGQMLDISSMTVQRAFEILAKRGLIISERGRGTFVAKISMNDTMFKISEFCCDMEEQGLESEIKLLENLIVATPEFVKAKGLTEERVLALAYLGFAEGEPMMYKHQYIVTNRTDSLEEEEVRVCSFAELVEKVAPVIPIRSLMTISAVLISAQEAQLLEVRENSPGFCIEQTLFTADETAVAFGAYICRGDRYQFTSKFNY